MPQLSLTKIQYSKYDHPKFLRLLSVLILRIYTSILLGFRIKTIQKLPNGPRIFAINHPTTADPFIIYSIFPNAKVLITEKAFKVRAIGWILRKLGHIQVTEKKRYDAFEEAKQTLLQGKDIIIFPEGTLSRKVHSINEIKTGITRLALETNSTIVPIGINLLEKGIKQYKVKTVKGETLISKWYLFNKYIVNIGKSIKLEGSVRNREYVKRKSIYLQEQIQKLSRKYFYKRNWNS